MEVLDVTHTGKQVMFLVQYTGLSVQSCFNYYTLLMFKEI